MMPISSRITYPALQKDQMVSEIHAIIKKHGWDKFVLVSHSYGSVISTHLIKSYRTSSLIGPIVLVDPICFLLHLPDVAYNFTARRPVDANEHQLWYFGSKDMGVAHTLARRFSWTENIIWKEDLNLERQDGKEKGRKVTVVLSGQDLIVNTEAVRQYLLGSSQYTQNVTKNPKTLIGAGSKEEDRSWKKQWKASGLEVLWYDTLDHSQVFDSMETRQPIVKAITVYSRMG
ncbi:conserved hypothetical protein [Paecilomyces variotii No. 5]|uniref:AB hydrolase-1 domain-containing protein n=1 Tax=Byssochlamys spectabilis (strain No. 5 / NBRC 109023) TaxID=1356009 RepID=V5HW81_BYSSN|nr:conserved hypothetical protein [Paecilomyces variotii No. 5]